MTYDLDTKYLELGPEKNRNTKNRDRFSVEWQTAGMSEKTPSDCALDLNGAFPWPENRFEIVYSSHVMEHLADAFAFLVKCHTVLQVGGTLRVSVPCADWLIDRYREGTTSLDDLLDNLRSYKPHMHRDAYNEDKLRWLLVRAGFHQVDRYEPGTSRQTLLSDPYFSNRPDKSIIFEGTKVCQK